MILVSLFLLLSPHAIFGACSSACPVGSGCVGSSCTPCINGSTFASVASTSACKPCSACPEGSMPLSACYNVIDTICADMSILPSASPLATSLPTLTSSPSQRCATSSPAAVGADVVISLCATVRYVRITCHGTAIIMNFGELKVFAGDLSSTNIARGALATQSDPGGYMDCCYYCAGLQPSTGDVAGLAVDGNLCTWQATNSMDNPWWQVDLGVAMRIQYVVFYNRNDDTYGLSWSYRMNGATIEMLDENGIPTASTTLPMSVMPSWTIAIVCDPCSARGSNSNGGIVSASPSQRFSGSSNSAFASPSQMVDSGTNPAFSSPSASPTEAVTTGTNSFLSSSLYGPLNGLSVILASCIALILIIGVVLAVVCCRYRGVSAIASPVLAIEGTNPALFALARLRERGGAQADDTRHAVLEKEAEVLRAEVASLRAAIQRFEGGESESGAQVALQTIGLVKREQPLVRRGPGEFAMPPSGVDLILAKTLGGGNSISGPAASYNAHAAATHSTSSGGPGSSRRILITRRVGRVPDGEIGAISKRSANATTNPTASLSATNGSFAADVFSGAASNSSRRLFIMPTSKAVD